MKLIAKILLIKLNRWPSVAIIGRTRIGFEKEKPGAQLFEGSNFWAWSRSYRPMKALHMSNEARRNSVSNL